LIKIKRSENEFIAGLYLMNNNYNEIEEIYYVDDGDLQDKYLFRDLELKMKLNN